MEETIITSNYTTLRIALKIVQKTLKKYGCELNARFNNYIHVSNPDLCDFRIDLVSANGRKIINSVVYYALHFVAYPCSLKGGLDEYTFEESMKNIELWHNMLKACQKLNNLQIVARPANIVLVLNDIEKGENNEDKWVE